MLDPSVHDRRGIYLVTAAAVVTAAAAILAVYVGGPQSRPLGALCREDGTIENLTAAMYFTSSAIFLYTCATFRFRNLVHWGYAGLFFLVGAEEISWGQRIFRLATPEPLRAVNVQEEINLHNVDGVHGNVRWIALLVVLTITMAMPLAYALVPRARALARRFHAPLFPLAATPIVLIAIALMAGPRLLGQVRFGLDEMGECYLSLAFLTFALTHLRSHRRLDAAAADRISQVGVWEDADEELPVLR